MENKILAAGVGAVAGIMFGYMLGGAGGGEPDTPISDGIAAQTDAIGAIGEDVEGLSARLAALEEGLAADIGALVAKVDAVPDGVLAEVAKSTAGLEASLSGDIAALTDRLGEIAANAPAADGPETAEQPAPAAAPAATTPVVSEAEGRGVGQTVLLLDGAARVFISSIDADEGTARVAINGLDVQTVGSWHEATFDAGGKLCTLAADNIASGKVALSASCE